MRVLGLVLYAPIVFLGAVTGGYTVASKVFDYEINVSIPEIIGLAVGFIAVRAFFSIYGKYFWESISYLRMRNDRALFKFCAWTIVWVVSFTSVVMIFGEKKGNPVQTQQTTPAAEIASKYQMQSTPKSQEFKDFVASLLFEKDPLNNQKRTNPYSPFQSQHADVCSLGNVFTSDELARCLEDLKKHPPKKGIGGRVYDLKKDRDKWIIGPIE